MKWNPGEKRSGFLKEDRAPIRFYLNKKFDPSAPMGNRAIKNVDAVISLWLCGLAQEIEPIFTNTLAWLDYAIESGETTGPSLFHRAKLCEAKAICEWLTKSEKSPSLWTDAMIHYMSKMAEKGPSQRGLGTRYVEECLPSCVFAGNYENGIAEFEKYCGAKTLSLKKTLRPREFAYALCLHRLRGEFGDEELFEAGKRMLRAYVDEEWLCNGEYIVAATWIKLVQSLKSSDWSPMQTLLSVYDVMGEPLPDFFAETAQ